MESVGKEEAREQERMINPEAIRQQLFIDESIIQPIDDLVLGDDVDDNVEMQEEGSDSEQLAEDEFLEEIDLHFDLSIYGNTGK